MAIVIPTLAEIQNQIFAFFSARFPGRDLGTEGFLGKNARALAMALLGFQKAVEDADHDGTPTEKTSSAALDLWATLVGISSNLGGYGRNGAVVATGGAGTLAGVNGTVFPDQSLLYASDGATKIRLSGAVTIPGVPPASGTAAAVFVAETAGIAGNLAIGSILTFASPPPGAEPNVALTSPLAGGTDKESDADLLERIRFRLQQPPKGGAAVDYRFWCERVTGVVRAYVYPNRGGTGTVHALISAAGSGTGRAPSVATQTAVNTYVNTSPAPRPVTVEEFSALRPAMPGGSGMAIRARVRPAQSKYNFDWDDTAATYTVAGYAPGPPAVLTLSLIAPASLKNAITLGLRPRLQVEATAGPAVPVQVRVTAFADVGPNTLLTLENPLPTGFLAPVVGNRVNAGGPIATLIAQEMLAYVDGLGPSRADGFADLIDVWEDTCAIARLTEIALSSLDPADDLTRMVSNLAVAGGVTINAGTVDRVALADISGSPELLYASGVVVTQ